MKKLILFIGLITLMFNSFGQDAEFNEVTIRENITGYSNSQSDSLISAHPDSTGQWKYKSMADPVNDLDGVNRRTLVDTVAKYAFVEPRDSILFNTSFVPTLTEEGTIWWNGTEYTLNIETGLGPTIQVGQEILLLYYNDTGIDIPNLAVLHPKSATIISGLVVPTPDLADASHWELSEGTLSIATQLIPNGQLGFAVVFGRARGGNTSLWAAGSQLWLSTTPGEITDTKPVFPDYSISLGGSLNSEAAPDGEIFVSITKSIEDTYNDAWDGSVRETFNFTTSSNGTVVIGLLENADNTRNLTLLFSDGFYTLDVTPADTIILTPGTDEATQTNYVYVPISTKVLTLSTSGFPDTEHCRITTLEIQSALNVQSVGGTRKNQNHNDHIKLEDDNGHILHIAAWIRRQFATWGNVGCEATFDATAGNGYVSTTAGKVSQLHLQDVDALSMPTVDIMIANDPDVLFVETDNLNTITKFSDGSTWNNKWGKIVVWLIANKTGEPDFLCVNLPRAGTTSSLSAIDDELGYADYSIPTKYKSNAILVGAFSINVNSGTVTYSADSQDLRGTIPSNIAGGGGAGGVTTFLALADTDPSFTANTFQKSNAGATALENAQTTEDASGNLDVTGTIVADSASITNGANIASNKTINQGASTFVHNFEDPTSTGNNFFAGLNAGNYTLSDGGGAVNLASSNTGVGYNVLNPITTGYDNTAYGAYVMENNTTGFRNNAFGQSALNANTTGDHNLAVGQNALLNNTTGIYNTALGIDALTSNVDGNWNLAIGQYAQLNNISADNNIGIGTSALSANITGEKNTAIGISTLMAQDGVDSNVGVGYEVFKANTIGISLTGFGDQVGYSNTEGNRNTYVGSKTGYTNTTGDNNVGLGHAALYTNLTGSFNMAIGYQSLNKNTSGNNTAVGANTLFNSGNSSSNTAVGYSAGNTLIGGNSNTFLGNLAGSNASQNAYAINSMALGNGTFTTTSNTIVLGNTAVTNVSTSGIVDAPLFITTNQSLTETAGAVSWDVSSGGGASVTIDETTVITMSNLPGGGTGNIAITQGDAGDDNVTFVHSGLTVKWRGDDTDLTDDSGAIDVISYWRAGSILFVTLGSNYVTQ